MRKLAEFLTDNLSYVFFVAAAGWATAFAPWGMRHPDLLEDLLLNNRLAPNMRFRLLVLVLVGMLLALLIWCGLGILAFARRRSVGLPMRQSATLALGLVLLAFVPVLSVRSLPDEHPFLTFFLVAVMALIAFVTVNRASLMFGPMPDWLRRVTNARNGLVATCFLTLGYVLFMSVLTVARHNSFMTHSFDLGIHDQIVYNALHHGVLRSTQHGPQPINYLGNHFAPILFLVAPLYGLNGDARTLLVLQSLFLGLGAVPVYLLAQEKLRSTALAVALATSYLLFPALHGINTFDFHQIALVTSLLLWALYFLETGRTKLFLIFLILAAATKEEVALTAAAFGIYLFLVKRRYLLGTALALGGATYFAVVVGFVMPALGGVPQVYRFEGLMAGGTGGLTAVVTTLLTNPIYVVEFIFGDPRKVEFLCLLLLPVLFMPLLAGRSLILAIPAFSVALLASVEANFSIGTQYPAIMVPFVSLLAIVGIQRLDSRRFRRPALAAAILIASLAMNFEFGWLFGRQFNGFPQATPHDRVIESFFQRIPGDATVSAASDLVPHLSNRDTIYMFPTTEHAAYILFDAHPKADFWPATARDARHELTLAMAPYLVSGEYGTAGAEDWVLLLKRGSDTQQNLAALRLLLSTKIEAEDLPSSFTLPPVRDTQASGGRARVADGSLPHSEDRKAVIYGPYASLLPGKYRVTYRLKLDAPSSRQGRFATADVFSTAMGGALAGQDILVQDFAAPGSYEDFTLDVEIPGALDDVEYRLLYDGPERIWVDAVEVTPLQVAVPIATNKADDLASKTVSLLPGKYRATVALTLAEEGLTDQVASVEVFSKTAGGPLATLPVDASAFGSSDVRQDFTLEFETAQSWPDVEFRMLPRTAGTVRMDQAQLSYLLQ